MYQLKDYIATINGKEYSTQYTLENETKLILTRAKEENYTLPDWNTIVKINVLIKNMVTDGFWQKQDTILNFAYNDPTLADFSLINWKNPLSVTNLVTYSSDMSHQSWNSGGAQKKHNTTDTLAPDGTVTACKLNDTGAYENPSVPSKQFITANSSTITYSIYTKSGTAVFRTFLLRNETTSTNFEVGTFNYASNSFIGNTKWSSTNVGNDWYRISYTQNTGISQNNYLTMYFGGTGEIESFGTWYVWGAQVEDRDKASRYVPTGANPIYGNGIATSHGGMVYSATGYESNAIDGYINTHFNPVQTGINYTLNDAAFGGVCTKTESGNTAQSLLIANDAGTCLHYNHPESSQFKLNTSNTLSAPVGTFEKGLKLNVRYSNSNISIIDRHVNNTRTALMNLSALTNQHFKLFVAANFYSAQSMGFVQIGGSISYPQSQNFRVYYNDFLQRIGLEPIA